MKIYLVDTNPDMIVAWQKQFYDETDIEAVHLDFEQFMEKYTVDCVVSPANSFGFMDGGYDEAIISYFGDELQEKVLRYIKDNYFGEQPVGTSFIINTNVKGIKLIHTPTMRIPEKIYDDAIIYACTRSCLITAEHNGVNSIVLPAFGGGTGHISTETIAEIMYKAWVNFKNPPEKMDWIYAAESHFRKTEIL